MPAEKLHPATTRQQPRYYDVFDRHPHKCCGIPVRVGVHLVAAFGVVWYAGIIGAKAASWRSEYRHSNTYALELILLIGLTVLHLALFLGAACMIEIVVLLWLAIFPFLFYMNLVVGTMVAIDLTAFPNPALRYFAFGLLGAHALSILLFCVFYPVIFKFWKNLPSTFSSAEDDYDELEEHEERAAVVEKVRKAVIAGTLNAKNIK